MEGVVGLRADGGEVLVGGTTTARSTCSISPGEVVEVGTVEGINCGEPGVRALAGLLLNFEFSSGMIVVTTLNLLANLGPWPASTQTQRAAANGWPACQPATLGALGGRRTTTQDSALEPHLTRPIDTRTLIAHTPLDH